MILCAALFSVAATANEFIYEDNDFVSIEDIVINPGEEVEIGVNLTNAEEYYQAFQCNIFLPEGLEFVRAYGQGTKKRYVNKTGRCEDMALTTCDIAPYGDLAGSLTLSMTCGPEYAIWGTEGVIFYFKVKAGEETHVSSEIVIKNVVLTESGYTSHIFADATGNVTMPGTLADYVDGGREAKPCVISESLACIYVSADGKTLYAKDDNAFAMKNSWPYQPTQDQVDNKKIYDKPASFDQSNWVAINLPDGEDGKNLKGKMISGVKGTFKSKLNPEIDLDIVPETGDDAEAYTPNLYTVASFADAPNTYFVMPPKPMEYASIRWAVYKDGNFYVQKNDGHINTENLNGVVKANTKMYVGDEFQNGYVYDLTAVVKALKPRVDGSKYEPGEYPVQDGEPSTYYELYPLTSSTEGMVTGINEIGVNREDNTYYNLLGQPVSNPTPGIYIKNGKKVLVK